MEDLSHGFLWVLVIHCFSFVDCKHNIDDQDILIPSVSSYDLGTSPSKQHGLDVNLKELSNWSKSFSSLASRDEALAKELESVVKNLNRTSNENVVEAYFKLLARPMQTHCKVGKWMAHNRFHPICGSSDGEWFVCMDNIYEDAMRGKCLVYSFGLSDDVTFEDEELASLGCEVHGYDPTLDNPPELHNPEKVHFHTEGLSFHTGPHLLIDSGTGNEYDIEMTTLGDALRSNGHGESTVSYLKVDVENSEVEAIPEWISSGALENVRQIGVELHTGTGQFTSWERPGVLRQLLKSFHQLYQLGFRLISYAPNRCIGQGHDQDDKKFYTYANVVFYKPTS